jgi:RES domain-containing protein
VIFRGRVWRHVPPGAAPLHIGKLFKYSAGRWNRRGEYACLYTALTREGALGELAKQRNLSGTAVGDRDLVSIDVGLLEPFLDITDAKAYASLAISAGEIPNESLLTSDTKAALEHCHRLADQARSQGYTGLKVPSAAIRGEVNLVIYFDVVAPKHLEIDDGPDRELVGIIS